MTIEASTGFARAETGAEYAVDYGVLADGVTNDLPGVTAAIAAAKAKAGGVQGKVILPPGDILITGGELLFGGDLVLEGAGSGSTTILLDAGSSVRVGATFVNEVTLSGTLSDLTIDGQNQADYGLICGNQNSTPQTGSLIVQRVKIKGCNEAAIWSAQTAFMTLYNVGCYANNGTGLLTDVELVGSGQTTTIRAFSCRFESSLYGVKLNQLVAGSFVGCSFEQNEREGFLLELAAGTTQPNRAIWLTDCYFEDNCQENGYLGSQAAWRSTPGLLIQQINLERTYFAYAGSHWNPDPINIDAGTGFATIDYPEQLRGRSIVRDENQVYLHVKDRYGPDHANWDWGTPTGLARINHEVWGGGNFRQEWVNSPTGPVLVHSSELKTGGQAWFGASPVLQQTASTLPELATALKAYGLLDAASTLTAGGVSAFTAALGTGDATATVFNNGGAGFVHNFGTATPTVTIYSDGQQVSSGWHANLNADNNTVDSVEFGTAPGAGEVLTIKIGA